MPRALYARAMKNSPLTCESIIPADNYETTCPAGGRLTRVAGQPPCARLSRVVSPHPPAYPVGSARHARRTLPTHEQDHHTRAGTRTGGAGGARHASERVQLKTKKTTKSAAVAAAAAAAAAGLREAALLYVAPNLSRGNYCARNCRGERNPSVLPSERTHVLQVGIVD